jgi:hypothetical protein
MKRIQRPIGVYLMTAFNIVVVGVIPLLTFVLAVRNSEAEFSFVLVLLSVATYFCVMGAAVWAWSGDDKGRWISLAAVTFVALQWIVNAILALSGSDIVGGDKPRVIGFISRGSIALALNWWYFNRKSTVLYYKQKSASAQDNEQRVHSGKAVS